LIGEYRYWRNRVAPEARYSRFDFHSLCDRVFPEFQILFRRGGRVTYANLTASKQAVILTSVVCAVVFFVYVGARVHHFGHIMQSRSGSLEEADRDRSALVQENAALRDALAEAESRASSIGDENDKLTAAIADAQKRISALESERGAVLADAQRQIDALDAERAELAGERTDIEHKLNAGDDKAAAKSGNGAEASKELEEDRELLRHADANQATLQSRVQALEEELQKANSLSSQYRDDLATIEGKLKGLSAERDRLIGQRSDASHRDQSLNHAGIKRPDAADLGRTGAGDEVTAGGASGTPAGTRLELLLASTGLDVSKLLDDVSGATASAAEGGPFVALGSIAKQAEDAERRTTLQKLVQILPLAAPLDSYRFESPFGPRVDPFNHRKAFHTGVDLSAPYRTHVMSTAPGIVIYAGADGEFGRLVEIDHGHGIVTRYAHLHRTLVVKGQKVPAHFPVGELGSTGRSTGPHVHYEVVVDGTQLDPAKFIGAGKDVVEEGSQ
jgi:murein DD-endopeptidase MepM/ murein hydrolase activator NlpD